MGKNIIKINDESDSIKILAVQNKIKPTNQNLVDLSFKIVDDVYKHLDSEDFNAITGLIKK